MTLRSLLIAAVMALPAGSADVLRASAPPLLRSSALQEQDQLIVAGRVVGPDGAPLADQAMMLHRVDQSGGSTIAETMSGGDGAFTMSAPLSTDSSAVYFVAARYTGELYIGSPFRQDEPARSAQLIQVGNPATSAAALMNPDGATRPVVERPATGRSWLLLIVPLVGAASVGLYILSGRSRIPPERSLLLRVAELDERMTSAPRAQQESLLQERTEIMARLRRSPSGVAH